MNTLSNDLPTATPRRFGMGLATWHRVLASVFTLVGATVLGVGCAATPTTEDEHVGSDEAALTSAQCNYFSVNGKVQICHRTGSASHPYSVLKISEQACINAHAMHAGDYVAVNDPTCQGGGCLPANAPCDATLPCCDGFSCVSGTCQANVSDHCSPSPCQNGSTCTNSATSYTCACPAGFTGTNCETEIDECASNPCQNGQCLDAINGYVCECAPGWTHPECDSNIDDCASSPCQNGDCVDHVNGYTCDCAPGWTHPECDSNIDDCASSPCQNGDCVDHVNGYTCDCAPGWTHPECDSNIDDCASSPCVHGDCVDHVNAYTCDCAPGWGGTNCDEPPPATCPCAALPVWGAVLTSLASGNVDCTYNGSTFASSPSPYGDGDGAFVGIYDFGGGPVCTAETSPDDFFQLPVNEAEGAACTALVVQALAGSSCHP